MTLPSPEISGQKPFACQTWQMEVVSLWSDPGHVGVSGHCSTAGCMCRLSPATLMCCSFGMSSQSKQHMVSPVRNLVPLVASNSSILNVKRLFLEFFLDDEAMFECLWLFLQQQLCTQGLTFLGFLSALLCSCHPSLAAWVWTCCIDSQSSCWLPAR